MKKCQLAIIGGGPAGLAAALRAHQQGITDIIILERDVALGGILNQCIHNGFGLHRFEEELTGPEYAAKFIDLLRSTVVKVYTDTMVLSINNSKVIRAVNPIDGCFALQASAIILAMGCRERTRGAISIPGSRCAGIYTAGTAQYLMNIEGLMVGRRIVILGSGDIGLIMARRMTLEGAKVLACVELMPFSPGLTRNIVQCLNDFDIPLYLSHTVTDIRGDGRLESVVVSKVDAHRRPIPGTEMKFDCDTLLLSVGLIPENELTRCAGIAIDPHTNGPIVYNNMETSVSGIFACGNVVHVHDLVDFVSEESERAGEAAAAFIQGSKPFGGHAARVLAGDNVSYTAPQLIRTNAKDAHNVRVSFRVRRSFEKSRIIVSGSSGIIATFNRGRMAPGEMEHVTIPGKLIPTEDRSEIIVSCEEVEA